MSSDLVCNLVTTAATPFTGQAWQVTVPGTAGRFSIRKDHAPIVASLVSGGIEIAVTQENRRRFTIDSGILYCRDNRCTIICSAVTEPA